MNFRKGGTPADEPEINLIAMIDVLLVILIFLMVTTTFSHLSRLSVQLPQASRTTDAAPRGVEITVDEAARYAVGDRLLGAVNVDQLRQALITAAAGNPDPLIIIHADARAPHQSVVDIMEAARAAQFSHLSFATRSRQ